MAATEVGRARHSLLHEQRLGAALARALVALLPALGSK